MASVARQFDNCLAHVQAAPPVADSIIRLFDRMDPATALATIARALNADWVMRVRDEQCGDIDDARQLIEHAADNGEYTNTAADYREMNADRQWAEAVRA